MLLEKKESVIDDKTINKISGDDSSDYLAIGLLQLGGGRRYG